MKPKGSNEHYSFIRWRIIRHMYFDECMSMERIAHVMGYREHSTVYNYIKKSSLSYPPGMNLISLSEG